MIDGKGKRPSTSWVPQEVAKSIIAQLFLHRRGIRAVAMANGMTFGEVLDVVEEYMERDKRAAYTRGHQDGRLSATFPMRPTSAAAKKAA